MHEHLSSQLRVQMQKMDNNTIIILLLAASLCKAIPYLQGRKYRDVIKQRYFLPTAKQDYFRYLPAGNTDRVKRALDSQGPANCGNPGTPKGGRSIYKSWYEGAIVTHSCEKGWTLVGVTRRVCKSNGKWVPDIPKCIRKSRLLLPTDNLQNAKMQILKKRSNNLMN